MELSLSPCHIASEDPIDTGYSFRYGAGTYATGRDTGVACSYAAAAAALHQPVWACKSSFPVAGERAPKRSVTSTKKLQPKPREDDPDDGSSDFPPAFSLGK